MKVIVLGAGVVGVTSAWYLAQAGHAVTVVERQPEAALETSFANGGQISASHAEPWSNMHALRKVFTWLGREDAPLLFRLRADTKQWRWGLQFLLECLPWHNRYNVIQCLRLALYSRASLKALRTAIDLPYDHAECGILHFYTDRAELAAALAAARLMAEFGCDRVPQTPEQIVALEPALKPLLPQLVGGDYARLDEAGDARQFTQALAAQCVKSNVTFRYGHTIKELLHDNARIAGVSVVGPNGEPSTLTADAYVVALGSYSPLLVDRLGVDLLIYPVKGYSVTIPITNSDAAPHVSLCDDAYKLVFSRLGERLRVAGTAEITGYDVSVNAVRCEAILRRTEQLFPQAGDFASATRWAGLRPATPSNVPYISGTKFSNLFLNTGHGTLGWTMACGSGRLLADLVSGRTPEIDSSAYAVTRRK